MVTSGSFSSILSTPQVASVSQREPKLSPKENGLSLYLGRQQSGSEKPDEEMVGKSVAQQQPYFGGPEAKVPTSSNKSSCEREDFALTGVSCSITCISDSTEWEMELWRNAEPGTSVTAQEKMPSGWHQPEFSFTGHHPEPSPSTCAQGWARPSREHSELC